jgi:hypothetical protein
MKKPLLWLLAVMAGLGAIFGSVAALGKGDSLSQAAVLNCFSTHRLSHPYTSLAEAQTCIPGAPLFPAAAGVPAGFTGAAVTQSGRYFTAHYFSKNP